MEPARPYPEGWDWGWLASDREGHLGLFYTGGHGAVPLAALAASYPEDVEQQLQALPQMSDARLLVSRPDMTSFVGPAERGIFVYDWSDQRTGAYELAAMPYRPRTLEQLAPELADAARAVRFNQIAFPDTWLVDVRARLLSL